MNKQETQSMEISDMISLFETVVEDACEHGVRMHLTVGERKMDLWAIYHEAMDLIKQATENTETEFLVIPLLQRALEYIAPLYFFSLQEYQETGINKKLARYETLRTEILKSPVLQKWSEAYQEIARVIEQMGMQPDEELLQDMPGIAEILLDAFRFSKKYATKRVKVSSGADSGKAPILIRAMPKFAVLGEFYDCIKSIGHESCVMFAVIAPTFTQGLDALDIWFEREPEIMRNSRIHNRAFDPDKDILLNESFIVIGIKRGDNIWLTYHKDNTARRGSFMEYGKRRCYLPYQVLFEQPPAPDKDCTDLALPSSMWTLSNIVDKEQSLWLPAFLTVLQREYFKGDIDPDEPVMIIKDSVKLDSAASVNNLIPVVNTRLFVKVDVINVPEEIETSPACKDFIERLNLLPEDIADSPIMPTIPFASQREYELHMWHRSRYALSVLASKRLKKDWEAKNRQLLSWYTSLCEKNRDFILEQLTHEGSRIDQLSEHTVDGRKRFYPDGSPMMESVGWSGERQVVDRTSIHDTRQYKDQVFFCIPYTLAGKRPPVVIRVTVETPDDMALLAGISKAEMPWQLQLWGECVERSYRYSNVQSNSDPMLQLDNHYHGKTTIIIAMSKQEYKKRIVSHNPGRAY